MENAENKTMAPAVKYAKEYMKTAKLPLTEVDLAHSFTQGKNFGRSAAWQRVDEATPSPKSPQEQIAILFEVSRHTYDIKVVKAQDFADCIGSRKNTHIPLFWAYLRTLLTNRIKFPRIPKETKTKNNAHVVFPR